MKQSKKGLSNWLLMVAVIALAVVHLIFVCGGGFTDSDEQAEKAIEVHPGHKYMLLIFLIYNFTSFNHQWRRYFSITFSAK